MRWNDYLKDRLLVVLAALCVVLVIVILLVAFRVEIELIIVVVVLCSLYTIGLLMFDFLREKRFYDNLLKFFDDIIIQKFANKKAAMIYHVANTPQSAVEYLGSYTPQEIAIKKEDIYSR